MAEAAGVAGAQTGPARPAAPVLHCYQTCMLHLVVVGYSAVLPPASHGSTRLQCHCLNKIRPGGCVTSHGTLNSYLKFCDDTVYFASKEN